MSNTVAGRRQFDNSQECIAKKRQWRRHANENTLEQNASIDQDRYNGLLAPITSSYLMIVDALASPPPRKLVSVYSSG